MTDQARVLEWLTANPAKGYRACSRALGLDLDQVTAWGKAHRGSGAAAPRAHTREPEAKDQRLTRLGLAEWQLAAAIVDLERYRGEERSGTAVAILHRTVLDLSRDLAEVRAAAERAGEVEARDTTPEDLRAAVAGASEAEFAVLLEAVEARRGGQRLRVVR